MVTILSLELKWTDVAAEYKIKVNNKITILK